MRWQTDQGRIELSTPTDANSSFADVEKKMHQAVAQGDLRKVEILGREILTKCPDASGALNFLGMTAYRLKQYDKATDLFMRAIEQVSNEPEYHNNLGAALLSLDKLEEAEDSIKTALEINNNYVEAHNNLGLVLYGQGDYKEAVNSFDRALKLNPNFAEAWNNKGQACRALGDFKVAANAFEKALELAPNSVRIIYDLCQSRKTTQKDADRIEGLLCEKHIYPEKEYHLRYALSKVYDDNKKYAESFAQAERANQLKRETANFDAVGFERYITRTIETFSKDYFEKTECSDNLTEQPVFLIGMPRSGSTLVEQILAGHNHVWAAGETGFLELGLHTALNKQKSSGSFPEIITELKPAARNMLGNEFVERLKHNHDDVRRIVEKTLFNFRLLGLIHLLFPQAKVIHCQRHPLDTCLSIYMNHFNTGQHYAYTQEEVAVVYQQYVRLMTHWQEVLPHPILEINYEELVNDIEQTSRRMIKFLGLRWQKKCLDFDKQKRNVKTGSAWQVHQPLYRSSIARWKNYEKHLDPMIDRLSDII